MHSSCPYISQNHVAALCRVCIKQLAKDCLRSVRPAHLQARTLFPPAAVVPIWERLQLPLEQTLSPVSLRALILLVTFFPFKAAPAGPCLPLHDIAATAVQLWLSASMNTFWDRLWLRFLARLAKWDTHVRPSSPFLVKCCPLRCKPAAS